MGIVLATEEMAEEGLDNARVPGRFGCSSKVDIRARSPFTGSAPCFEGTSFAFFAGPA